jgi:hypothetical protein
MTRHETCADSCSLGDFLKLDEEACEGDYCEKQELVEALLPVLLARKLGLKGLGE